MSVNKSATVRIRGRPIEQKASCCSSWMLMQGALILTTTQYNAHLDDYANSFKLDPVIKINKKIFHFSFLSNVHIEYVLVAAMSTSF